MGIQSHRQSLLRGRAKAGAGGQHAASSEAYRAALTEYRSASALDPAFTIAQANTARALRELGDPVASRAAYDAINARLPDLPDVIEGYAELAIGAGNIDQSIALLQQAAALDPGSPHYFSRIGQVELDRGNAEAADEWFKRALALDPAYPLALNPSFAKLLAAGDLTGGETLLRAAANYEPTSAEVQALHGISLTLVGRNADALEAFDRSLAITPDNAEVLYQSANMLQNLDRQADAIDRLNRAIALDPYNPALTFSRGTSLAVTGHNAEARADFERVLELDTSGTQYGSLAESFIGILDGPDAAAAAETEAPAP